MIQFCQKKKNFSGKHKWYNNRNYPQYIVDNCEIKYRYRIYSTDIRFKKQEEKEERRESFFYNSKGLTKQKKAVRIKI